MKRLILSLALFTQSAIAAPIDDAKWVLCRSEVTAALQSLGAARPYILARDFFAPCGVPAPIPVPVPTPTPSPAPAPVMGIAISGQTAFLNALSGARGGEVFNLADGNYTLAVTNIRPASTVTIQGSRNVKFGAYGKITGSSNLRFGGVSFFGKAGMADGQYAVQIGASSIITFDGVLFSGVDATGFGLFVRTKAVNNLRILNSEWANLKYAGIFWGGDGLLVEGGRCHGMASDCFQIANTTNATIRAIDLYDAKPHSGFHPDGVQLTGVTVNTTLERIRVRGNMQGLFYDGRLGRQKNLIVRFNDIAVSYPNAIRFDDADGLVSGNVITKGGQYAPIFRYSAMKSDGTNVVDGVRR